MLRDQNPASVTEDARRKLVGFIGATAILEPHADVATNAEIVCWQRLATLDELDAKWEKGAPTRLV